MEFIEELKLGLYQTFILDNNYQYFLKGIGITLLVTVFALILGMILGVLVAIIRSAHDQQPEKKNGIVLMCGRVCFPKQQKHCFGGRASK